VEVYREDLAETRFAEADALLVLDTGNRQRIGGLAAHLDRHAIAVAVVDHHVTHDGFGHGQRHRARLRGHGRLVYELMKEAGVKLDALARETRLYVGSHRHRALPLLQHRRACPAHAADLVDAGWT
jgi:nanoRNase/pAp phosphatase (c-di-AMP/oligoRNAs hydrolase)